MLINNLFRFPGSVTGVVLCLSVFILVSACGGGGGGPVAGHEGPTASLFFSVEWDRTNVFQSNYARRDVEDCSDVATVSAAVYSAGGALLQTGGPWSCTDGGGTIRAVPANQEIQIVIVGHISGGPVRYRGDTGSPFFLPAGAPYNAGRIVAGAFVPVPTSPADGATVLPAAGLTLAWNPAAGAESYIVEVTGDSGFDPANLLETLMVQASHSPSCQPDTSALTQGTAYFWRVVAIDGAGNESEGSVPRQFSINTNDPPVATITRPANNSTFFTYEFSEGGLDCSGFGTDLEDKAIPGENLVWWVTDLIDGRVLDNIDENPVTGNTILFFGSFFTPSNYRITLQATDSDGNINTTFHDITVVDQTPE